MIAIDQTLGKADFKEVYEYDSAQADDVKMADKQLELYSRFNDTDLNCDGKVSFEEIKSYNHNFFKELFNVGDKNHDGFIDWPEAKQASAKDFDELDWNHDGKLSFEGVKGALRYAEIDWNQDAELSFKEFKSYNQNFINEMFNDEDKNHDGFVDWNEAKQTSAIKFDEAYWNHDGKLSFEENKSYNQNFKEMFNDVDKNLDGFIDLNETKQASAKDFVEADWNHDGKLSFEEIKSYKHNFLKEMFNYDDKNHDGFIDLNEEKQATEKMFNDTDWNCDGKLSFEEIKSYNQNFINEKFNDEGKNHDGFIDWNEAKQASAKDFAELDWNHDGKLSFEGVKSFSLNFKIEMFNDHDKNHDGFVDWKDTKEASRQKFWKIAHP